MAIPIYRRCNGLNIHLNPEHRLYQKRTIRFGLILHKYLYVSQWQTRHPFCGKRTGKIPIPIMIKNYLVVAIRNLMRNKVVSIINISGLSIGLACCMLIVLYTKDELSYDRFHKDNDRIYRITMDMTDEKGNEVLKTGKTGAIQGAAFKQDIPEIRDFVRICQWEPVIRLGGQTFEQQI